LVVKKALKICPPVAAEPHAGIADRDQHLTIITALRLDGELARPITSSSLDAVNDEVH